MVNYAIQSFFTKTNSIKIYLRLILYLIIFFVIFNVPGSIGQYAGQISERYFTILVKYYEMSLTKTGDSLSETDGLPNIEKKLAFFLRFKENCFRALYQLK